MSTPIWAIKGMNKVFSASNITKGFTLKKSDPRYKALKKKGYV